MDGVGVIELVTLGLGLLRQWRHLETDSEAEAIENRGKTQR
jgi:hypothetical protein